MAKELDKKTTISVKWCKKRGMKAIEPKITGDKLPNDVLLMLLDNLLRNIPPKDYMIMIEGR